MSKYRLSSKMGMIGLKIKKVLVVVQLQAKKCSGGGRWKIQTHPIELKFGTLLERLKWMLNFEFGQNRLIRKKILVIATPTGFE